MKTMQKNRIVLAITAVVVLALLFAGIGYAFSGDARTYNKDDDQTLAYMSVTPENFNKIFTGDTIFDTYVYEGATTAAADIKTAYAFDESQTVVDLAVGVDSYKAVELGSKVLTVLNNTGAEITKLKFTVNATGNVGSTDFVFIFELTNADAYVPATGYAAGVTYYTYDTESKEYNTNADITSAEAYADAGSLFVNAAPVYIVYSGANTGNVEVPATLADTANNAVTVKVFVAYKANVYVPNDYIGPANAEMYVAATGDFDSGAVYYTYNETDKKYEEATGLTEGTYSTAAAGTYYVSNGCTLPYIQTENEPVDLATTSFRIVVTDATTPVSP